MKMITLVVPRLLVLSLALVASVPASASDIQKCLDWEGTIVYQDTPCEKGTEIGKIPRDTSQANPDAIRRAEEDRRLLANILLAKASRPPATQVVVAGPLPSLDYTSGDDTTYTAPVYGYAGSGYGRRASHRPHASMSRDGNGRNAIAGPPSILDSPAPCNTLQCRQASGAGRPVMRSRH